MGRRVVLITGDARQVADAVSSDVGVDEVMAEVLPEDKDAKVAELQLRGLRVVGDQKVLANLGTGHLGWSRQTPHKAHQKHPSNATW